MQGANDQYLLVLQAWPASSLLFLMDHSLIIGAVVAALVQLALLGIHKFTHHSARLLSLFRCTNLMPMSTLVASTLWYKQTERER